MPRYWGFLLLDWFGIHVYIVWHRFRKTAKITILKGGSMENNLKSHREAAGLTLEQVANMAGTTKSYIWELEQNKNVPGLKRAYLISAALNKSVYEVFPDRQEYETETVKRVRKIK